MLRLPAWRAAAVALLSAELFAYLGYVVAGVEQLDAVGIATKLVALAVILTDRLSDREGAPPWYSAWALFPGAFLLAGAASMCIFGALVEMPAVRGLEWALLAAGALTWAPALIWVRRRSSSS
jgi:hypothetical protein